MRSVPVFVHAGPGREPVLNGVQLGNWLFSAENSICHHDTTATQKYQDL